MTADSHTDLIYYESAPGLQGLHVYQFDKQTVGGESSLVDVFHVAGKTEFVFIGCFECQNVSFSQNN